MNAEELEIARRLVACKGWVWLLGMRLGVPEGGELCRAGRYGAGWDDKAIRAYKHAALPDLSDDLTRLGVLAVVRRAWGEPFCGTGQEWCDGIGDTGRWSCYVGGAEFNGDTEAAALLAALEAAP